MQKSLLPPHSNFSFLTKLNYLSRISCPLKICKIKINLHNLIKGEEDGKEKAKSQMINGIVAIAVTVSLWGIVALLQTAFGVNTGNSAPTADINNMIPGGSR